MSCALGGCGSGGVTIICGGKAVPDAAIPFLERVSIDQDDVAQITGVISAETLRIGGALSIQGNDTAQQLANHGRRLTSVEDGTLRFMQGARPPIMVQPEARNLFLQCARDGITHWIGMSLPVGFEQSADLLAAALQNTLNEASTPFNRAPFIDPWRCVINSAGRLRIFLTPQDPVQPFVFKLLTDSELASRAEAGLAFEFQGFAEAGVGYGSLSSANTLLGNHKTEPLAQTWVAESPPPCDVATGDLLVGGKLWVSGQDVTERLLSGSSDGLREVQVLQGGNPTLWLQASPADRDWSIASDGAANLRIRRTAGQLDVMTMAMTNGVVTCHNQFNCDGVANFGADTSIVAAKNSAANNNLSLTVQNTAQDGFASLWLRSVYGPSSTPETAQLWIGQNSGLNLRTRTLHPLRFATNNLLAVEIDAAQTTTFAGQVSSSYNPAGALNVSSARLGGGHAVSVSQNSASLNLGFSIEGTEAGGARTLVRHEAGKWASRIRCNRDTGDLEMRVEYGAEEAAGAPDLFAPSRPAQLSILRSSGDVVTGRGLLVGGNLTLSGPAPVTDKQIIVQNTSVDVGSTASLHLATSVVGGQIVAGAPGFSGLSVRTNTNHPVIISTNGNQEALRVFPNNGAIACQRPVLAPGLGPVYEPGSTTPAGLLTAYSGSDPLGLARGLVLSTETEPIYLWPYRSDPVRATRPSMRVGTQDVSVIADLLVWTSGSITAPVMTNVGVELQLLKNTVTSILTRLQAAGIPP